MRFIDAGMYDLCMDTGDEVTQITDEVGFERSREPSTKFVMRVVLTQRVRPGCQCRICTSHKTYTCPRCKKETKVERQSTSASMDWYDFPVVDYDLSN